MRSVFIRLGAQNRSSSDEPEFLLNSEFMQLLRVWIVFSMIRSRVLSDMLGRSSIEFRFLKFIITNELDLW